MLQKERSAPFDCGAEHPVLESCMARFFLFWFVFLLGVWGNGPLQAQNVGGVTLVEARLVASGAVTTPGEAVEVGVYLKIAPGWHTYWINPGDSGLPIAVEWELPEGWSAGPLQWPIPEIHREPGDMLTYGYEKEVLLTAKLTPPPGAAAGGAAIRAKTSWLVCKESCVPGGEDLELTLPSSGEADAALFARLRGSFPESGAPPFALKWEPKDTETYLKIEGLPESAVVEYYSILPIQKHPEALGPRTLRIPYPTPPEPSGADGLLVVRETPEAPPRGWYIQQGQKAAATAAPLPGAAGGMTLGTALWLGFLGGFILNLMPCVLPVIALKIFGFLKQVGQAPERVFRLGLAFVAGIFAWFLGMAALVVGARMAGADLNWAFQFQNPIFVLVMTVIVFVFALNLLGVFEIWLPGTGKLVSLSEKEGYGGAFLHGAFATLMATPCTAPFLGPALPFAFSQPPPVTFAMFAAIATGMGLPYILLTARPGWMRFLPKPGLWMVRLKQAMGFLLLGTALWLVGISGSLDTVGGPMRAAWLLLGIGAACWIFGTWVTPGSGWLAKLLAIVAMVGVIYAGQQLGKPLEQWESWSPTRIAELRREGKPVFVDFTADWCFNCKVNERFVLHTPPVEKALTGFVKLKADWTRGDPAITAALRQLGRAGVPVYAVYPAGGGEPEVLPELLTQGIVTEALERARK